MPDDFVDNDEILYRRISARRKLYKIRTDGTIEISSEAFSDRHLRVSVDRAKLCDNNPRYTLGNEPGVVVGLLTSDVRNLDGLTRNDQKGNPLVQFKIDVEPVPLLENPAHAEIFAIPAFENDDKRGAFHRLCRRLVRLVEEKQSVVLYDD
jgi:hypothetical protein